MVKFAGKEYQDGMTIGELARRLEVEGAFVFSYNREPTAQEILNGC